MYRSLRKNLACRAASRESQPCGAAIGRYGGPIAALSGRGRWKSIRGMGPFSDPFAALALCFDAGAILKGLRPWMECESPTFDAGRLRAGTPPASGRGSAGHPGAGASRHGASGGRRAVRGKGAASPAPSMLASGAYPRASPWPSRSSEAASTRTPAASCSGEEYSAGLWLMPLWLGTKIMPVGQTGTMNCAS